MFKNSKAEKKKLGIPGTIKTDKVIKVWSFDKLNKSLYIWFRQECERSCLCFRRSCPATSSVLLQRTSQLYRLTFSENSQIFFSDLGILMTIFGRFDLRNLKICRNGEKLSADSPSRTVLQWVFCHDWGLFNSIGFFIRDRIIL